MPKGMTPKERMGRSTMSLARNLKPSGRLNVDDIEKAGKLRKTTPFSEQKNMKKFSKYMKQEPKKLNKPISSETMKKMAGMLGSSAMGMSGLMKKAKEIKPTGRISKDDLERAKNMLKISFPKKLEVKGPTPSQRRTSAKRKPPSAFPSPFRTNRPKGTRAK
jgi:hypothetical protein